MRHSTLHKICCFVLMLSVALVLPAPAVTLSSESGSTTTSSDSSSGDEMGTMAVYGLLTLILATLAWVALRSDFGDPLAAVPEKKLGPVDATLVFGPGPETGESSCELSAAVQLKF